MKQILEGKNTFGEFVSCASMPSRFPAELEKGLWCSMSVQALSGEHTQSARPLIGGKKFDVIFFLAVIWFVGGAYTDAWAHNNIPRLKTFWTPWHGILYSGLAFLIFSLAAVLVINYRRGANWHQFIPQGYQFAYLAIPLIVLTGLGDMTWHLLFGVEQNLDALFSPTHLTAILCFGLFTAAPLYSMSMRKEQPRTFGDYALLATAFALPYISIMNPAQPFTVFTAMWPDITPVGFDIGQEAAFGALLIQSLIFTFLVLYFTRRWTFKPGMFTYILGFMALCLSVMNQFWFTIPVYLIGGTLLDVVYWYLKPSTSRILQMRLFSALASALPCAVYLIWVSATTHVVWTVHMLTGSVYVLLMFGWVLSYLPYPARPFAPSTPKQE